MRHVKPRSRGPRPSITEPLEQRTLFSIPDPLATVDISYTPVAADSPAVAPFTPAQIRHFYGLDNFSYGSTTADGTGQTIAIIGADNAPDITTDLATFDSKYGLTAPPSFDVVNQTGGTPLPATYNASLSIETSLDVEWSHAMAPGADIVLIECNSTSFGDLIAAGVTTANSIAGVSVVSISYGAPEFSGQTAYDRYFNHNGVTYVAAVGDSGSADTFYPATSPDVVAVGGSQITTSDSAGSYGSETVWNDPPPATSTNEPGATGGDISAYENRPSYQSAQTQSASKRMTPDVSFDASTNSGVYVIDSSQSNGSVFKVGGTSLAAPSFAGIVAVADQGRAIDGQSALTGSTQTLPDLYKLPPADFHDITTGNNNYNNTGGYDAGAGYDLASGLGTPVANLLIPGLAGYTVAQTATVTGRVFQDNNADGTFNGTDTGLADVTVYLDQNSDGVHEPNEPTAVTNSSGGYVFTGIAAGTAGQVLPLSSTGYVLVATAGFTAAAGQTSTANVALFPTSFGDSNAGRAYTVQVSPADDTRLQILVNGTVTYDAPISLPPALGFTFTGSGDSLAVDFGNGDPLDGTLSVNGTSASDNDTLKILGTTGDDTITVNAGSVVFGDSAIKDASVPNLSVDPRTGTDSLTVNSGTVTLPAAPAGGGILARTFSNLSIAAGARLAAGTAASRSDRTVLDVDTLSITGTGRLDLGGNDMIVTGDSLAAVNALVTAGYAGRAWNGDGISSSAAAADTTKLTSLGVIQNNQGGTALFASSNKFDGIAPATSAILIKYTYVGDANLDGTVDGGDYSLTDAAFSKANQTGWYNGDFNFDGKVDGSDYSLIDFTDSNANPAIGAAATVATAPAAAQVNVVLYGGPFAARDLAPDATPADPGPGGVSVVPFRPAEIRRFSGIDSVAFGSVVGNDAGQTIAIIDACSLPDIVSDLANFAAKTPPAPASAADLWPASESDPLADQKRKQHHRR
jgi:hypothetical protein